MPPASSEADRSHIRGEWWLPSRADLRIGGDLEWTPTSRPLLKLSGSFQAVAREDHPSYPLVHGNTYLGEPLTLIDAQQVSMPPFSQELVASHALVGTHLQSPADGFELAFVKLDVLGEWIGRSGVRHGPISWDMPPGQVAAKVEYIMGEQPTVRLTDGSTVRVQIGPGLNSSRYEVLLRQDAAIEFRPAEPKSCAEMAPYVRGFRELLALITDYPVKVTEAQMLLPGSGAKSARTVSWLARWSGPIVVERDPVTWHSMLFNLDDASNYWEPLLQRWYDKRDALADSLDLLLSLTYAPPTFLDTQLVLAVQSAEAYHRRNVRNLRCPRDQFKKWRDEIVGACPKEDRMRVEELLGFANEPTLRERLTELRDKAASALPMLFDRYPNWVDQTTKMRNAYTHRGSEKGPSFDPKDLYNMAEVTPLVVKACILLDLGVPDQELAKRILNNSTYSWLLSRGLRPTEQQPEPLEQ
jgi:hypothetical protein